MINQLAGLIRESSQIFTPHAGKVDTSRWPRVWPGLTLDTEGGSATSFYPVSDFAQTAIALAVNEVLALRKCIWNVDSEARVDRMLTSRWCDHSVYPIGWDLPASWDEFSGDYQARDGWIRLHTNAPQHRKAVLRVLNQPADKHEAASKVSNWPAVELESAVVAAGGAAAVMMSREQWQAHTQGKAVNSESVVAWQASGKMNAHVDDLLSHATPARPLQGVRVLDLTRVLAGPVSTRFLASLGADVLRIDPPDWDEDGIALEMTVGKRCAGLDLRTENAKARFESLLTDAHVIVHGYRRDALPRLGFDAQARSQLNPALIDVALNAYGWTGHWSARRGFDSLVQMSSGIAEYGMRRAGANRPTPLPFQALDHVTGYLMAATVVYAIARRASEGQVLSARLSLARQARLLQDMSVPAADTALAELDKSHFTNYKEETPWGEIRRLRLPYMIEGVDLRFNLPVCRLRSSTAHWSVR